VKGDRGSALAAIGAAFRNDQANAYKGADADNATRLVGLLRLLSGILALAFLPLATPDSAVATAGVAALGLLMIGGAIGLLKHKKGLSFNALLAISYSGLVQVALIVWLGGDAGSAYQLLFLLGVGSAMGVHPPRRAFTFLAATAVAASAPLVYDGWSSAAATDIFTHLMMWAALGTATLLLMITVRAQRLQARADELREHELARADALTGLGNRRAFDEALDHEIARSRRADSTVSVLLIDIDRLKAINDRWGHVEGDRCIVDVARAIAGAVRAGDRCFRWGGDEFAVLLPDTDLKGTENVAEFLSAAVRQACVDPVGAPLSISLGAAEIESRRGAEQLVARADIALMARKRERAFTESIASAPTQAGAPH
jgi:diguanylate cyclase (GGDEF)-like protein